MDTGEGQEGRTREKAQEGRAREKGEDIGKDKVDIDSSLYKERGDTRAGHVRSHRGRGGEGRGGTCGKVA